jgi:5-methylcytosine-specific restriction endonuclease McrA
MQDYQVAKAISRALCVIALFGIAIEIHRCTDRLPSVSSKEATFGAVKKSEADDRHMPDPRLTPGKTVDVSDDDLCKSGYTATVRHVTPAMKKEVFERYGIKNPKPGEYEIDHLISLELGGANDIENLWPQRYSGEWNAHMKDRLENKMHDLVCSGKLPRKQAQKEISEDWVECYQKYVSN